jgi:hypothetical protein
MQKNYLNDLHSTYVNGNLKRQDFEGLLYNYFLCNQDKTCLSRWKRDEYEDYVSWFYHRLKKAIDSYRDIGSSFAAFMSKFIFVSAKEYRVRVTTENVIEDSAWTARVSELYTSEEPPAYLYENNSSLLTKLLNKKTGRKNKRSILALVLKCYYYVSDDFIDKIAPKIGIEKKELAGMIDTLRKTRQKKDDEIYLMKERIYCQYYRCIVYEKRILHVQKDSVSWEKLNQKSIRAKKRLENMRKRLSLMRTEATHSQVAEVIGVKKGTIDASLHMLKAKLNSLAGKSMLN